jgi:hypothetical protein
VPRGSYDALLQNPVEMAPYRFFARCADRE